MVRVLARLTARPVLTVGIVALAVRLLASVLIALLVDGLLIPDEIQYLQLAEAAAEGRLDENFWPGYGLSLYDSTGVFMRPLGWLFAVIGPYRFLGQALAAVFGAAAAAGAAWLALDVLRSRRAALAAGLIVALMPSQVLWSSVVLRESPVWFALVALALAVTVAGRLTSRRALAGTLMVGCLALLALGDLRDQTLVAAAWSLPLAVVLFRPARPVLVRVGAVAMAVVIPAAAGIGFLGIGLVARAVPALGTIRAHLSLGANSSIIPAIEVPDAAEDPGSVRAELIARGYPEREVDEALAAAQDAPVALPADEPPLVGSTPTTAAPAEDEELSYADLLARSLAFLEEGSAESDRFTVLATGDGQFVVDESATTSLAQIPTGAVAVLLRPMPWEGSDSLGHLLARLENPAWYLLYALAAVGVWALRRERRAIAYVLVLSVAVLGSASITQGNIGTAFRHRGQLLWAFALLAVAGTQHLLSARSRRRGQPAEASPADREVLSAAGP